MPVSYISVSLSDRHFRFSFIITHATHKRDSQISDNLPRIPAVNSGSVVTFSGLLRCWTDTAVPLCCYTIDSLGHYTLTVNDHALSERNRHTRSETYTVPGRSLCYSTESEKPRGAD